MATGRWNWLALKPGEVPVYIEQNIAAPGIAMVETHRKSTVLVVDDTPANIEILSGVLGRDYRVKVATNGEKALQLAIAEPQPDIILLDIMMPGMDGYEVCERLKANPGTQHIPVIFVTALSEAQDEARGLVLGGVDYITKPFNPDLVKARVKNHIELKLYRDELEQVVAERTRELLLTRDVVIEAMGTLAEYRDPETGGHIRRTQGYVRLLAEHLRDHPRFSDYLDDETIELLFKSAPLHDIGKVGIADEILLKPGRLTSEEFEQMKLHTILGRDAIMAAEVRLGENSFLMIAREIAESHQEKWDGSGYPHGLAGDAIPISGRLMAVADVYDALISKRVYKPPFPHSKAVELIKAGRGTHFDPDIADAFLQLEAKFRDVALRHIDHEEERQSLLM